MAFSAPCPDLLSPLLEEHSWRRPCGSWEAACRLAVLSKAWRDEVNSWRAFERTVRLDLRADVAAVKVVAKYCRNLQCLDLRGCTIKPARHDPLVASSVPQPKQLQLGGCTAIPTALRLRTGRSTARNCWRSTSATGRVGRLQPKGCRCPRSFSTSICATAKGDATPSRSWCRSSRLVSQPRTRPSPKADEGARGRECFALRCRHRLPAVAAATWGQRHDRRRAGGC